MKTSPFFIDDTPLQILFFDENADNGRSFFNAGLGTVWFDYDLHLIKDLDEAQAFLEPVKQHKRSLDLLFVSNSIWTSGGEQFVEQIRAISHLSALPIYCVAACPQKRIVSNTMCMNTDWRKQSNCNHHSQIAALPFAPYLALDHPARLTGTLCGNNISDEVSDIIKNMSIYWFQGEKV